jgi:DNA-binding response OmpR family regulator
VPFDAAVMLMETEKQALATLARAEVVPLDRHRAVPLAEADDAMACGPLWISPNEMCEVRIAGRRVPMSLCHLKMLACLLEARGRVVSRQDLYRASGATDLPEGSRRVDVHVTRIRQSLGVLGNHLVAVRRRGYRLDTAALARLS